jgi:glucokinase
VGVALPGFLDPGRRRVVRLSNLPVLDGIPLERELRERTGLPVHLDTDTNAGAVAEAVLGAGNGCRRVLYLTLGTGVGAALVVDGAPVRVSRHTVGQVAHIPLAASGPRCSCGGRGCAESLLSSAGLLRRARGAGLAGLATTEDLWRAALSGRGRRAAAARAVWRGAGELAGGLLSLLAGLFSPDAVIVGGGTAGAAPLFLPVAAAAIRRRWPRTLGRPPVVRAALLGRFAGAYGAALLARQAPPQDAAPGFRLRPRS